MAVRGDQGAGDIYSDDFQTATLGGWWTAQQPSTSTVTIVGAETADALFYLKLYGSSPSDASWTPRGTTKYVRNVRISGGRIRR